MEHLSVAQARRVALAAQGFGAARPRPGVGMRQLGGVLSRVAQFQIDSVNVCERAHYFPLYSRLGPYPTSVLDRAAGTAPRRVFEYLGHAASFIDVALQPALRMRMERAEEAAWGGIVRVAREHPGLVEDVHRQVVQAGPITARQLRQVDERRRDHWGWNWSAAKTALEWLWWCGRVVPARRNAQFERCYDLPERVLPREVLALPTPTPQAAARTLVHRAAVALGVADCRALADYFRLGLRETREAIAELVADEVLRPVSVGEHPQPWYAPADVVVPRRIRARALVSPFDSLVFERERLRSLFGSLYRIEIYVPQPKRVWGYYVYPFLLDERIAARVDLKADRARGHLVVQAAWLEPGNHVLPAPLPGGYVAAELAAELRLLADWLGLGEVTVGEGGDLAGDLRAALRRSPGER